jgi:hypothetical protein
MSNGFLGSACNDENGSQLTVDLGIVRSNLGRLLVLRQCVRHIALSKQGIPQAVAEVGIIRVKSHGLVQVLDCFLNLAGLVTSLGATLEPLKVKAWKPITETRPTTPPPPPPPSPSPTPPPVLKPPPARKIEPRRRY